MRQSPPRDVEHSRSAVQLPAENRQAAAPDKHGRQAAHAASKVVFEKSPTVSRLRRFASRQMRGPTRTRAPAIRGRRCRSTTTPTAPADTRARRTHGGSGADVRRQERRENQSGAERSAAYEKLVSLPDAAANPGAQRDEAERVDDEYSEERRPKQACLAGGRSTDGISWQALRGADRPQDGVRHRFRGELADALTFGRGRAVPCAIANSVSPSDGVCAGTMRGRGRHAPSPPPCRACAFVSFALVTTTPIDVFSQVSGRVCSTPRRTAQTDPRALAVRRAHAGDGLARARVDDAADGVYRDDGADDQCRHWS